MTRAAFTFDDQVPTISTSASGRAATASVFGFDSGSGSFGSAVTFGGWGGGSFFGQAEPQSKARTSAGHRRMNAG
jgi:hypothetical protein